LGTPTSISESVESKSDSEEEGKIYLTFFRFLGDLAILAL
jgi:hypothetical protein